MKYGHDPAPPQALIRAHVVRYLLAQGVPCDVIDIRHGAGLSHVPRDEVWKALRWLVDCRMVEQGEHTDTQTYEGFDNLMTYPVFWVSREAIAGASRVPASLWWDCALMPMHGEGVIA